MGKRKGGGGGEGRGGGGFGGREDQYGGFGGQDRDDGGFGGASGGGKGQGGGGSAGGGAAGSNVKFQRYVPKFLQGHMGLLQRDTPAEQEEPTIVKASGQDVSDDDEGDDGGALQRALEENSALAGDQDVQRLVSKQKAQRLKENGNAAFASKNYTEAVRVFTECIELDPTNEIYLSNRSAAHAAAKEYGKALGDADAVVRLKPSWAKGYARKGAAHFGLEEYSDAISAYERAIKLEPNDEGLEKAKLKAEMAERQQAKDGKIKFKKRRTGGDGKRQKRPGGKELKPAAVAAAGVKNKTLLSFAEDEDEEGG